MVDLLELLWIPFLMCLVLTGIHAYLGVHVLAREVVFVDIALAQIAALGATAAFLVGYDMDTWESYAIALFATLVGALVLSLTRTRRRNVSQEAVIGVVYAVSSAGAVLLADRAAHGIEHIRAMLVGSLLAVRGPEVHGGTALRAHRGGPLAVSEAVLPDLDRSRGRVRAWLERASLGFRLLRVVRCRGDKLGSDRRRAPRLLVSHRAGARGYGNGRNGGDAAADRLEFRHTGQRAE